MVSPDERTGDMKHGHTIVLHSTIRTEECPADRRTVWNYDGTNKGCLLIQI